MKKDLTYYLNLRYPTIINSIPESEGGGYESYIAQLGRFTFIGDGETPEEALADLEKTRKRNIREMFEAGEAIPEPTIESDYSGKLIIRIPKYLHKLLAEQAKSNGASLNQHITSILSIGVPAHEIKATLKEICDLWRSTVYRYESILMKKPESTSAWAFLSEHAA